MSFHQVMAIQSKLYSLKLPTQLAVTQKGLKIVKHLPKSLQHNTENISFLMMNCCKLQKMIADTQNYIIHESDHHNLCIAQILVVMDKCKMSERMSLIIQVLIKISFLLQNSVKGRAYGPVKCY